MNVSIVICTYNRVDQLPLCLHSVKAQTVVPYELIVVEDDPRQIAEKIVHDCANKSDIRIVYIANKCRMGLPATRNVGIKAATGDVIAFIDDDVVLAPNWLEEILKCYKFCDADGVAGYAYSPLPFTDKSIAAPPYSNTIFMPLLTILRSVFSRKLGKLNPLGFLWSPMSQPTNGYKNVDYFPGCNMTFRANIFETYEFDPAFQGTSYAEEADFATRIVKEGKRKLFYNPNAAVIHYRATTGGIRLHEKRYWSIRNHILYLLKNYNLKYLRVTVFSVLISLYYIRSLPDVIKGVRDGIKQYLEIIRQKRQ